MTPTEQPDDPLRVAIVGAGPAGFYTAGALIDRFGDGVSIDLVERLLAPYGLVRYGVAPDHPKLKSVARVYERIALSDAVRFIGNVTVGDDVAFHELQRFYDAVIVAVGAQTDRLLGIPGESLASCISSGAFVAWYNAHPFYADFAMSLDHERVAVVGIGNVAIDVTRILVKSAAELSRTDIADAALAELRQSTVRDVYVLARRGPAQAKCTPAELRELGTIEDVSLHVDARDLEIDAATEAALESDRAASTNVAIFRSLVNTPRARRRVHFRFYTSPVEVLGEHGATTGLRLQRNAVRDDAGGPPAIVPIGEEETLDVSLVIRAIGYRATPIEGLPFDAARGIVPNTRGRVVDPKSGEIVPRAYVVGWAKRGPRGLIGSNKADAQETVNEIADDLARIGRNRDVPPGRDAVLEHLAARGVRSIAFDHWQVLDRLELARGEAEGRPRVKFARTEEMITKLDEHDRERR